VQNSATVRDGLWQTEPLNPIWERGHWLPYSASRAQALTDTGGERRERARLRSRHGHSGTLPLPEFPTRPLRTCPDHRDRRTRRTGTRPARAPRAACPPRPWPAAPLRGVPAGSRPVRVGALALHGAMLQSAPRCRGAVRPRLSPDRAQRNMVILFLPPLCLHTINHTIHLTVTLTGPGPSGSAQRVSRIDRVAWDPQRSTAKLHHTMRNAD
jgi:hypothetical protein